MLPHIMTHACLPATHILSFPSSSLSLSVSSSIYVSLPFPRPIGSSHFLSLCCRVAPSHIHQLLTDSHYDSNSLSSSPCSLSLSPSMFSHSRFVSLLHSDLFCITIKSAHGITTLLSPLFSFHSPTFFCLSSD